MCIPLNTHCTCWPGRSRRTDSGDLLDENSGARAGLDGPVATVRFKEHVIADINLVATKTPSATSPATAVSTSSASRWATSPRNALLGGRATVLILENLSTPLQPTPPTAPKSSAGGRAAENSIARLHPVFDSDLTISSRSIDGCQPRAESDRLRQQTTAAAGRRQARRPTPHGLQPSILECAALCGARSGDAGTTDLRGTVMMSAPAGRSSAR